MSSATIAKPDKEKIAAIRRELTTAVNLIDRCERCKLDMTERRGAAFHLTEVFDLIQREFLGTPKVPEQ